MATDQEIVFKSSEYEKFGNDEMFNLLQALHEEGYVTFQGDIELTDIDWNDLGKPSSLNELKECVANLEPDKYSLSISHAGPDGDYVPHNRLTDVVLEIIAASKACAEGRPELSLMSVYSVDIGIVEYSFPEQGDYDKFFAFCFGGDGALDNECMLEQLKDCPEWNRLIDLLNRNLPFSLTLQSNVVG